MTDYFSHIYDETYHDVFRYVISKCKDLSYAEDIMQNIYTKVYRIISKKGYDYIDSEKAFIINIAKRELYKYYLFRRTNNNICDYNDEIIDDIIDVNKLSIEDQVFENISIKKIWEEIKKEKVINQKIMILFYLEDMTIKEISELINMNESTVKSNLYRTLSRLKKKLGDDYE